MKNLKFVIDFNELGMKNNISIHILLVVYLPESCNTKKCDFIIAKVSSLIN